MKKAITRFCFRCVWMILLSLGSAGTCLWAALPAVSSANITGFAPSSGPIGTVVTISGSGFGATVNSNVVYAGGVECPVLTASPTSLTVQIPFGANYAPLSVTANHLTSFSRVPFVVTFPTSDVLERNSFVVQQNAMSTGELPFGIAIGDLNRDGKTDIVSSSNDATPLNGEGFDVFENTSAQDGTVAFGQRVVFSAGVVTRMVGAGDFDGDGWLDMAVVNYRFNGDTTVSLYRNRGLAGTAISTNSFEPRVDFRVGHDPREIVIADFNLDGKIDMAVTNIYKRKVTVLRNIHTNFGGAFSSASFDTVQFPAGVDTVLSIVAGDLNGDGRPELILGHANSGDNSIRILVNTSTGSTISFDPVAVSVVTGGRGDGVSLGDVDGDGDLDILVTLLLQRSFCVLRNNGGLGFTRFEFAAGEKPRLAAVGDLDGDGKPDIAIANRGGDPPTAVTDSIYVYKNTSSGGTISFAPLLDFVTAYEPRTLSIGDMNADGRPEILVANRSSNTISVFRNVVRQPATITSISPGSGPVGSTVTIQGQRFHPVADSNRVFFGSVRGSVVSASPSFLSAIAPSGNSFAPLSVLKEGLQSSAAQFVTTFPSGGGYGPSSLLYQTSQVSSDSPRVIAAGDLDGDGKPDMVAIRTLKDGFSVFRNITSDSTIVFSLVIDSIAIGGKPEGLALGDVNGDGKPDVVVMNTALRKVYVFLNHSTLGNIVLGGHKDFLISGNSNALPREIGLGDFDGDGRLDLVTTMQVLGAGNPDSIVVLRNLSSLDNVSFGSPVGINIPPPGFPRGLDILDIDRDGRTDIAVADWGRGQTLVLRNTSMVGNLAVDPVIIELPAGVNPINTSLGDLNGDGKQDLVTANFADSSISVYENTSSAGVISFQSHPVLRTARQPRVSLADVNGDGHPDVIASCGGSEVLQVFINRGGSFDSLFTTPVVFTGSSQLGIATLADFNADGKPDVVTANQELDNISVFRNTVKIESASFQVNPGTLSFGGAAVGSSVQDSVLVTNVGGATLSISSVRSLDTLRFRVSPGSADLSQLQNASFHVTFSPTSADVFNSKIIFTHNALPNLSDTMTVSGQGLANGFGLSSTLAAFGNVLVGDTARNTITVRNSGNTGLTVQSASSSNPAFGVAPSGASIPPGDSVLFTISFSPTVTGTQTGFAFFVHNAQGSPDSVVLSGAGVLPVFQSSTTLLDFGSAVIGQPETLDVVIQNIGSATLRIDSVEHGLFFYADRDTTSISAGGFSAFRIGFAPSAEATYRDTLRFYHNGNSSPNAIAATGVGDSAGLSSTVNSLGFGNVAIGNSVEDTVFITNTSSISQHINFVFITGDSSFGFSLAHSYNNTNVPANSTIGIRVQFAPEDTIHSSGYLQVLTASNGVTVRLTGNGVLQGLQVNPPSLDFGTISAGFDSTLYVIAKNTGTSQLNIVSVTSSDPSFVITRGAATLLQDDTAHFGVRFTPLVDGSTNGTITFTLSTSLQFQVQVEGSAILPTINFSPFPDIVFDSVNVGESATREMIITNSHQQARLKLNSVSGSLTDYTVTGVSADSTLNPQESDTITVHFQPTQETRRQGKLSLFYNSQKEANNSVNLIGTGVRPGFAFGGSASLPFPDTYIGETGSIIKFIFNSGSGTLRFSSVDLSSNAAIFHSGRNSDSAVSLVGSVEDTVYFHPTDTTTYSETITIFHNAVNNPAILTVSGRGRQLSAPTNLVANIQGGGRAFSWTATPNADKYHFQLSLESSFNSTVVEETDLSGISKVVDPLAYNTTYYWRIRAKRSAGAVSNWSAAQMFTISQTKNYANALVSVFPQNPTDSTAYRLLSLPGIDALTAGEFLGPNGYQTEWRAFSDTGGTLGGHLSELQAGSHLESGKGYWVIHKGDLRISRDITLPQLAADGTASISIKKNDWNIIGNPFEQEVNWNQMLVENGLPTTTNLSSFNGAFQRNQTILTPFKGYYFYNSRADLDTMKISYPFPGQPNFEPPVIPILWKLRLGVTSDGNSDTENTLGISSVASTSRDVLDIQKPPAFGDGVYLYFDRRDWDERYGVFWSDFRPAIGDGQVWEFTVQNRRLKMATIEIAGLEQIPDDLHVVLVNLRNTAYVDMRQQGVYSYQTVSSKMNFKLLVGSESFVETEYQNIVPKEFSLAQNYPNPFNPTTSITFKLPGDAGVRLEVLTILGQHVASIADGRYTAGIHTAIWNGRNDNGADVASGVYLYRMMINGSAVQVRKMLLLH